MSFEPCPIVVQVSPSNPSGTVSATFVMAGLGVAGAGGGWSITPQVTGRVLALVSGNYTDAATATTITAQIGWGTGAAPANGDAVGGTNLVGGAVFYTTLTGTLSVPFALQAVVTGLAVTGVNAQRHTVAGTAVWFDLAFKASAANSFTITNLSCTLIEL